MTEFYDALVARLLALPTAPGEEPLTAAEAEGLAADLMPTCRLALLRMTRHIRVHESCRYLVVDAILDATGGDPC